MKTKKPGTREFKTKRREQECPSKNLTAWVGFWQEEIWLPYDFAVASNFLQLGLYSFTRNRCCFALTSGLFEVLLDLYLIYSRPQEVRLCSPLKRFGSGSNPIQSSYIDFVWTCSC